MLSGRLPPGRRIAPGSGKIGKRAGMAPLRAVSSIATTPAPSPRPASGEQDRGQLATAGDRRRMVGAERLEELDQLLTRRLVLPFSVSAHDSEQLVDRGFDLAAQEQARGAIEAGGVIVRIGLQTRAQGLGIGERAGLLGQAEGGARAVDL